ncbi:hypothetical protein [Bailinhaonella thermotolerans]|uniref:Uncharacterized protein n=1 Tax=Bailinhaonella thermotolerans TaxID=1070861 RepID=A0A3A4AVX4_9ACTN|nr:hypothetical protein [Bailinhaonella thermotolerans]RJL34370.1 hypothetical protein D5H75_07980 [Bailinhaonella thermotolerans]
MRRTLRRIGRDIRDRRNIDAYVITLAALVFAVLSVVGGLLTDELRWGIALSALSLLVYRITIPDHAVVTGLDHVLADRSAFVDRPLNERLARCRELWLFAPSGINFLSPENCEALRTAALSRPDGAVRVVILDPHAKPAVDIAARQLDDSLDFPLQRLRPAIHAVVQQLELMRDWDLPGSFQYRFMQYNPGFSLVAIDPAEKHGVVIVEFHGYHNESNSSRMHLEITREDSARWYAYWTDQFDRIWRAARPQTPARAS